MRKLIIGIAAVAFTVAACSGGGAGPTGGTPTSAATPAVGQPTATAGQPTATTGQPSAAPGGALVTVVLTGGPDAGTYSSSDAAGGPNCSNGLIGPNGWGVQFSLAGVPDDQLSSLQMVIAGEGEEDSEDATFPGTVLLMTVTIGDFLTEGNRIYEVAVRTDESDDESSGEGSADVADGGATAVITGTGTTSDGVQIAATVNCPSIIRL